METHMKMNNEWSYVWTNSALKGRTLSLLSRVTNKTYVQNETPGSMEDIMNDMEYDRTYNTQVYSYSSCSPWAAADR